MRNVTRFLQGLSPWNETCRWKMEIVDSIAKECPIKGVGVVQAPYYLVFYGEKSPEARQNAGYMMEQMVLYLTTKGLGSCYQGGARMKKEKIQDSLKALLILAFGYPVKCLLRDGAAAKRYPLKELCIFKEEVGEEEKAILYAARLAPSACNTQPWRFVVYQGKIHVFIRKNSLMEHLLPAMKDIHIGIVLCHMQLAAEEQWLSPTFSVEEKVKERNIKKWDYVTTLAF